MSPSDRSPWRLAFASIGLAVLSPLGCGEPGPARPASSPVARAWPDPASPATGIDAAHDGAPARGLTPALAEDSSPEVQVATSTRAGRLFLKAKLGELDTFKAKPEFHYYGFAAGGHYGPWLRAVEARRDDLTFSLPERTAAGDLEMLGLEYMTTQGRETEYTRFARVEIAKVIGAGAEPMPPSPVKRPKAHHRR